MFVVDLILFAKEELQVEASEDLKLRLTHAIMRNGKLRFGEEIYGSATLEDPYLARTCTDRDDVVTPLEIEAPRRSRSEIPRLGQVVEYKRLCGEPVLGGPILVARQRVLPRYEAASLIPVCVAMRSCAIPFFPLAASAFMS